MASRLHEQQIPFALGGSGMLHLLGLTDEVGDLDLQAPTAAHDAVREAAGRWWVDSHRETRRIWRSAWIAQLQVGREPVEVIGGLALIDDGGVRRIPLRATRDADVDGVPIPLADPALWWVVYRAYRPDKAGLLEQVVSATARRRALTETASD